MKLNARGEAAFDKLAVYLATAIKIILSLLLVIATIALCLGMVKAGVDLLHSLHEPLEVILQQMLLDTVFIVALVEIIITVLSYLDDGKVHVRYIVDTILIIMLNEIVTMWFKHPELKSAIALSIIVATLAAIRIALTLTEQKTKQ